MKIGIFTDAYKPYMCGVSTSVEMLSKGLRELGNEVYIICLKPTKIQNQNFTDDDYIIRIGGMPIYKKGIKDFRFSFFNFIKVKKLFKYNFDLVHIHSEFSIAKLGLLYAKKKKVPLIYTAHTLWEDYLSFSSKFVSKYAIKPAIWTIKKVMKKYIENSFYTIVPTEKTKNKLLEYGLISNYRIIPTGIDFSLFKTNELIRKNSLEIRKKLDISENDFCFLYLGRVSPEKNVVFLLKAFLKLEMVNLVFVIVGKGTLIDELKDIAKKSISKNRVIFVGEVLWEEVKNYYNMADCFLNASTSETQGLTYLEALASGLPVIVKEDNAVKGLITEKENGLFFNTEEELIQKMRIIYSDFDLQKSLSKNAIKSVEKYSKECYTNNVLSLYETLIF